MARRARAALRDNDSERFRKAGRGYLIATLARADAQQSTTFDATLAERLDWARRYTGEHDFAAAAAVEQHYLGTSNADVDTTPGTLNPSASSVIGPVDGPVAETQATLDTVIEALVAHGHRIRPDLSHDDIAAAIYLAAAGLLEHRGRNSVEYWLERHFPHPDATIPVDLDDVAAGDLDDCDKHLSGQPNDPDSD